MEIIENAEILYLFPSRFELLKLDCTYRYTHNIYRAIKAADVGVQGCLRLANYYLGFHTG